MDRIDPARLNEEQRELADLIGMENLKRMIETYGGCRIYIPKPDGFIRISRNERIQREFTGYNYRELALKYKLTEQMIRLIVADIEKEVRARPPEGQMCLFK